MAVAFAPTKKIQANTITKILTDTGGAKLSKVVVPRAFVFITRNELDSLGLTRKGEPKESKNVPGVMEQTYILEKAVPFPTVEGNMTFSSFRVLGDNQWDGVLLAPVKTSRGNTSMVLQPVVQPEEGYDLEGNHTSRPMTWSEYKAALM